MAKLHEKYYKHRDLIRELLSAYEINSTEDLSNALKEVFAGTIQDMLEAELDEHLGYEKNESGTKETQDRRNGNQKKKIISHLGESEIAVPRDRDGSFQPQIVAKGQKDVTGIESKVISMYGKGMSTRDMQDIIQEIYGIDLSPETISRIIDHFGQSSQLMDRFSRKWFFPDNHAASPDSSFKGRMPDLKIKPPRYFCTLGGV
jgi:transposase-like protein